VANKEAERAEMERAEMERLAELKAKRKMESWSEQFKFLE
jgi:hypothetical protein